jgi:drug/metabolite transporter (DMT)-like permease
MNSGRQPALWLAALAALCFATAPVVLIWAEPLSAYEKSAWRMLIAAMVIAALAWSQRRPPRYQRQDAGKFLVFGFVTALHFLAFVAALNFTSIAHAVTVTYTAPIFVTLFSALFLNEHMSWRKCAGVVVVLVGIGVLVGFEPMLTSQMLIGDGLALLAALSFGVYSVLGRSQREVYPLLTYTFGVYAVATLWLIPPAVAAFTPSGYGLRQILALLWVGVIPLAVGHTLYNAAIRRAHATYANLIATQEVTGSVVLGALLLGQVPPLSSVVGIVIALVGIALVLI